MTIFDTMLFSMIATIFTMKAALLGAAAVLLAHALAQQIRRHQRTVAANHEELELHI
jgi:hypothetical protein